MLAGRLGLERARIPHADRHGLVWLDRGRLEVEDGCLRFLTAGGGELAAGDYQIPHQAVSIILLGPGSSVTHDALRLLARHGCALAGIGEGAVRSYTALPLMPDSSTAARAQVKVWADPKTRMGVPRAMYAIRFGEFVLTRDIEVVRGQEGARIKRSYQLADLYRHDITLEIAFGAAKEAIQTSQPVERMVRRRAAKVFRQRTVIPSEIDKIKVLLRLESETTPPTAMSVS